MLVLFRNLFAPPRDLILVVVSLWIGLWLAEKRSRWNALSSDDINNLTFYPLLSFLLAGRLLFALENWNAFSQNLGSLLSLNLELFDPLGGVVAALIVAWAYSQRRKLILWSTVDALTPLFATRPLQFPKMTCQNSFVAAAAAAAAVAVVVVAVCW